MHGWLRITIFIFYSQAQTMSDHTLFSDIQPDKCATGRSSASSCVREIYLVRKSSCKNAKTFQKQERNAELQARKRVRAYRRRHDPAAEKSKKFAQNFQRTSALKKSTAAAVDSRKICKDNPASIKRVNGWGTGIRLADRRARELTTTPLLAQSQKRPPSRLASASRFQADRGQRLHRTWLPLG